MRSWGLRFKIFSGLTLLWVGLIVAFFIILTQYLITRFESLEENRAHMNLERLRSALMTEAETIKINTVTWAFWDDAYHFMQNRNEKFVQSNLSEPAIYDFAIDLILFLDTKGSIVVGRNYDRKNKKRLSLPDGLMESIKNSPKIWRHRSLSSEWKGIWELDETIYLFASVPIMTGEKKGPIQGSLIFARRLDREKLSELSQTLGFYLTFIPKKGIPDFGDDQNLVVPTSASEAAGFIKVYDFNGQTVGALKAKLNRDYYQQGLLTLRLVVSSLLISAVIFLLLQALIFERLLFRRLATLSHTVKEIGEKEDLDRRLPETGSPDELETLRSAINKSMDRLQFAQKRLREKVKEARELNKSLRQTQNQLLQKQKFEAVSTLAAGIAHDFNNLIGAILGSVSVLENDVRQLPDSLKRARMISKAAQRAADLVKKLLTFARPEIESSDKKLLNLNDLVTEAQQLLTSSLGADIKLRVETHHRLWPINGNATQIIQVLLNLGMNAKEAMPRGGEIIIQTENIETDENFCRSQPGLEPGHYVCVRVTDTGVGIPKSIQEKIFDPFFTTKAGKGSGLGLSVLFGIMKDHGGVVGVYSEEKLGSVFSLYFPAKEKMGEIDLQPFHFDEQKVEIVENFNGRLFLVADDDYLMRELARDLLETEGAVVLTAESGREAVKIFKDHEGSVSLVILDFMMPDMNGAEAFAEIRKISPSVPVLLSSGFQESAELKMIPKSNLNLFMSKPYRRNDLLQICWKALRNSEDLKIQSKA